jgi:hypothetical protein
MAVFSGLHESPGPPTLGDVRGIVPVHRDDHRNGHQSGYMIHCCFVCCRPGSHRGDTEQVVARWRCPVASRVALDLPYWAMRLARYRLIRMAIKMASESAAFFSVVDYLSCITVAK